MQGYFDAWLPQLAPSAALVAAYRRGGIPFALFSRRYRREMRASDARHLIDLLAEISRHQRINLGCFCADQLHCHRSVLRQLIEEVDLLPTRRRPAMPSLAGLTRSCASPPCAMPEISD